MKKKVNKKEITLELPDDSILTLENVNFLKNGDGGLFFQSRMSNKSVKDSDGKILQNKLLHGNYGVVYNNSFSTTYNVTLKEMKALVKYMEKRDRYFKDLAKKKKNPNLKGLFCVHFSPDLTFFVKDKL